MVFISIYIECLLRTSLKKCKVTHILKKLRASLKRQDKNLSGDVEHNINKVLEEFGGKEKLMGLK